MKRCTLVMLLILTAVSLASAQDETIPPPRRMHPQKVGAVGGFTTGWLFLDMNPINSFLTASKFNALNTSGMLEMGGAGAAYIMVLRNFRVGGAGMSGSLSSSALEPGTGIRRDAQLKAGYGAVTFEYVIPIFERLDLVTGLALGTGGIDLVLRKNNGTASTWQGEQHAFDSSAIAAVGNITRTLSGKFYIWSPSVSLEYAFLGWLGVRVGASYLGMSSPTWTVDSNYDLLNVPSEITGKGWMINLDLLVGTF